MEIHIGGKTQSKSVEVVSACEQSEEINFHQEMEDYFFSSIGCFYLICSRLRGASAEKPACDGPHWSKPVKTKGDNCSGVDSNDMTFVAL